MSKHEKFILDDLPESSVVNRSKIEGENGIEDFINNAVHEHIKKIANPPVPFEVNDFEINDFVVDNSSNEVKGEDHQDIKSSENSDLDGMQNGDEKNHEQGKKNVDESLESRNIDEQIDIEDNASKKALSGADQGNKDSLEGVVNNQDPNQDIVDTKVDNEIILQKQEAIGQLALAEKLMEQLTAIAPEDNLNEKVAKLSSEAISGIAKKLHLILPVNFEEIICKGLIDKLNRFYKEGNITIKVNPERYEFCSQILQFDSIPAKFKDNFKIVKDKTLTLDDCVVEWQDTTLEYNKEQLSEEVDIIIKRLTNAA